MLNTVKYLKASQVFYQLWYKLKNRAPQRQQAFKSYLRHPHHNLIFHFPDLIVASNKLTGYNSFHFLNLSHQFNGNIDWNFQDHGKLWNYNLRYFDYLLDESVALEIRLSVVQSFYTAHLNNKVQLEPYPSSLRIINWILFSSRYQQDANCFVSLKKQIEYLQKNLEFHIAANHLLENYISLMVAAIWLRDDHLFRQVFRGFKKQVAEQILTDGAHYELSPMYHCIIFSKLLLVYDIYLSNNWRTVETTSFLKPFLSRMMGWLNNMLLSETIPLVNDAAPGIAPEYSALKNAFNALKLSAADTPLCDSGYRTVKTPAYQLLMDVGNVLPSYQPGHAHSDALSFILHAKQTPIFIDMGVSTYNNTETRRLERSTEMHNTVTINRKNQSQIWSAFRMGKRAVVTIEKDTANSVSARHSGYYRSFKATHCRDFSWSDQEIIIEDVILSDDNPVCEAHFHIDYNLKDKLSVSENSIFFQEENLSVIFERAILVTMQSYQQAIGFNKSIASVKIVVSFKKYLTTKIRFS